MYDYPLYLNLFYRDFSANDEDSDEFLAEEEKRKSVYRQSRRKGENSTNKNGYENSKTDGSTNHLPSSLKSSLSETVHNDVCQSEVLDPISTNSETHFPQCDQSSKCHSNTVLYTTKTVTKTAAIEAVSAILPNENDNQDFNSDNGEAPMKVCNEKNQYATSCFYFRCINRYINFDDSCFEILES